MNWFLRYMTEHPIRAVVSFSLGMALGAVYSIVFLSGCSDTTASEPVTRIEILPYDSGYGEDDSGNAGLIVAPSPAAPLSPVEGQTAAPGSSHNKFHP